MTTEEKLKHFQEICMTDAREKSARMLDDCVRALDAAFEEHKACLLYTSDAADE